MRTEFGMLSRARGFVWPLLLDNKYHVLIHCWTLQGCNLKSDPKKQLLRVHPHGQCRAGRCLSDCCPLTEPGASEEPSSKCPGPMRRKEGGFRFCVLFWLLPSSFSTQAEGTVYVRLNPVMCSRWEERELHLSFEVPLGFARRKVKKP